jgi:O-antigen/teichoic acid export membrane protein
MNKYTKILAVILLGLFIAYNLFDLNGITVIFWAIALYVGYGLLLASMRIWQKRKIRKYYKKHKTIPKTYEDLEKHLKSSVSVMPHLKKKLTLPNVTLLSATSTEMEEAQIGKW